MTSNGLLFIHCSNLRQSLANPKYNKFVLISAVNYSVYYVLQSLFLFIYCGYRVCVSVKKHVMVRRQHFSMSRFSLSILNFSQVLSCHQLLQMVKLPANSPVFSCHVMVRVQVWAPHLVSVLGWERHQSSRQCSKCFYPLSLFTSC